MLDLDRIQLEGSNSNALENLRGLGIAPLLTLSKLGVEHGGQKDDGADWDLLCLIHGGLKEIDRCIERLVDEAMGQKSQ